MFERPITYLALLFAMTAHAQVNDTIPEYLRDDTDQTWILIAGDSIPRTHIDLDGVILFSRLKFESTEDRRAYLLLRRRVRKVYPYAKLASERLANMEGRIAAIPSKRRRNQYIRRVQKYVKGEFTDELKKLSRSEGRILVKLVHRQTGDTVYDLIKEWRTGWRAFRYNVTASIFDISLKTEYRPYQVKEDFWIEDVLLRSFQDGILERQDPAFPIDYFELTDRWGEE